VIKYIIRNNTVGEHGTTPREAQRQVGEPKSSKGTAHGSIEVIELIELRDIAHDVINSMLSGFPKGALPGVHEKVAGANGLIAVSPVFTTSYSGLFKSFMDVLGPDSLAGMPVLPGATGGTPGHSLALEYAMRRCSPTSAPRSSPHRSSPPPATGPGRPTRSLRCPSGSSARDGS
jgi:FMN reductase